MSTSYISSTNRNTVFKCIASALISSGATAYIFPYHAQKKYSHHLINTKVIFPAWAADSIPQGIPQELDDILQFLQDDSNYKLLGAQMPRGIMLYGPPGTGKTTIARTIAQKLDITFIYTSASDLSASFYGVGPQYIREMFQDARDHAQTFGKKVVVFIDEIDGLAAKRNFSPGHGPGPETLSQLLIELDGIEPLSNIFVIGSTNLLEVIDPALIRPGRLERSIFIGLPNVEARKKILLAFIKDIKHNNIESHIDQLAEQTHGLSIAALKSIINSAAIIAARSKGESVELSHITEALNQIKKENQ